MLKTNTSIKPIAYTSEAYCMNLQGIHGTRSLISKLTKLTNEIHDRDWDNSRPSWATDNSLPYLVIDTNRQHWTWGPHGRGDKRDRQALIANPQGNDIKDIINHISEQNQAPIVIDGYAWLTAIRDTDDLRKIAETIQAV